MPWPTRGWLRIRYGRPGWLADRIVIAALDVLIAQLARPVTRPSRRWAPGRQPRG